MLCAILACARHQLPKHACPDEITLLKLLCIGILPKPGHLTHPIQNRILEKVCTSL